ncbi:hypothetical protein V8G54_006092 [Vigna mungo]|uniref:DUF7086 domain-containing protein n=1 Tax=Vigna mungo TaxID=3915 RepID=A0AAQ3NZD9_VIGMU
MESEELDLTLSLRCGSSKETPTSFLPLVSPFQTNLSLMEIQQYCSNLNPNPSSVSASSDHSTNPPNAPAKAPKSVSTGRPPVGSSRRSSRGKGTSKTITAPFPWAKNQRATVHSQQYLLEKNVETIKGKVYCKRCDHEFDLDLNLEEKLDGLCELFRKEKSKWHKRAPRVWMSPVCPKCPLCERESSTRPVIARNKKEINWLFLLLGEMFVCDNFEGTDTYRKNSMESKEELDLTLSLRCGTSEETPTSFLSLFPVHSFQTNLPQTLSSNIDFNPNPSSLSLFSNNNNKTNLPLTSCDDNANPPNATVEAAKNVSTVTHSLDRSRQTSCTRRSKRKSETVPALFPWAKNQRATVHTKEYLLENNINNIKGKVHCKRCEHEFEMSLNLEEKLNDLCELISKGKHKWHNRAPRVWMSPVFPKCPLCDRESSSRPIIAKNKKEINWLFLLLGQMLGCCTLNHLKYFCKHNEVHRTGAKDRLLHDTYKSLVNQLLPGFFV